VRALVRRRFLPRESAERHYALVRGDSRRLGWGEALGAEQIGEHKVLYVYVDVHRGHPSHVAEGVGERRGDLLPRGASVHPSPVGPSDASPRVGHEVQAEP